MIATHGVVDGLINVAGIIQPFVKLNDLDYEVIERVINVNLYGTIHMVKAFLPHLLERPVAHVANVSSMGGFLPVPGQTIYGASKAAVKLMTEGLYAELLDTNVGVSVIFPGAVATEITSNSGVEIPGASPMKRRCEHARRRPRTRPGSSSTASRQTSSRSSSAAIPRMMNLFNRVSPRRSTHLIYKQMKDLLSS